MNGGEYNEAPALQPLEYYYQPDVIANEFRVSDRPSQKSGRHYFTHVSLGGYAGFSDERDGPDVDTWHKFQTEPSMGGSRPTGTFRGAPGRGRGMGRGGSASGRGGSSSWMGAGGRQAPAQQSYTATSSMDTGASYVPATRHAGSAYGGAPAFQAAGVKRDRETAGFNDGGQPSKAPALTPTQQSDRININTIMERVKRIESTQGLMCKYLQRLCWMTADGLGYDPDVLEAQNEFQRVRPSMYDVFAAAHGVVVNEGEENPSSQGQHGNEGHSV